MQPNGAMNRRTAIIVVAAVMVLGLAILSRSRQTAVAPTPARADPPAPRSQFKPRLPAPRLATAAPVAEPQPDDPPATNLIARLLNGDDSFKLSSQQVETCLQANRRSAEGLLAAFRTTEDPAFLWEAMEKYPNDPRVNFAACFAAMRLPELPPEERRQRLEAFKQSAPDNALANYLSAQHDFQSGQTDQAVQELVAAFNKSKFRDYSGDFVQNIEEAYRAAGYSEGEAKAAAAYALPLPQLAELRRLGQNLGELANLYRQAGDESSAQSALQMGLTLGQRVAEPSGQNYLIHDLVGLAIERQILERMDPASPYDSAGHTVQDRLSELAQRREVIRELQGAVDPSGKWDSLAGVLQTLSEQDLISFFDRVKVSGELEAMRWVRSRQAKP